MNKSLRTNVYESKYNKSDLISNTSTKFHPNVTHNKQATSRISLIDTQTDN